MFKEREKALALLKQHGHHIALADACPRPWAPMKFYVAVGTRNLSELTQLGFHKGSKAEIDKFLF